jgi:hypothetical protein
VTRDWPIMARGTLERSILRAVRSDLLVFSVLWRGVGSLEVAMVTKPRSSTIVAVSRLIAVDLR